MAKGIFAVYRDPTAPPAPSTSSSRPIGTINKPSSRRKDTLESTFRGLRLQEKENVDPFAPGKAALGKGKKPALASKAVDSCGAKVNGCRPPQPKAGVKGKATTNGICTGTLKTRVIPDSFFADPPALDGKSDNAKLPPANALSSRRPEMIDIYPTSTVSTPSRSPSSASDSGYARSNRSGKSSDGGFELDKMPRFGEYGDESDASREDSDSVDGREADRRARALTESPLAEITQAFTGLGGFSTANMSPSPCPTTQTTLSRPPAPVRTRSSPSKTTLSAIPPRMQPYSTTATTKRAKPGQGSVMAPKTAPSSSRAALRF
ncbi:hypothetical protein JCM11641_006850 [Rhodosporidiobolus odoratus]